MAFEVLVLCFMVTKVGLIRSTVTRVGPNTVGFSRVRIIRIMVTRVRPNRIIRILLIG